MANIKIQKQTKMKTSFRILVFGILASSVAIFSCCFSSSPMFDVLTGLLIRESESSKMLMEFYRHLNFEQSKEEVSTLFEKHASKRLKLIKCEDERLLLIMTPLSFSAENWLLFIQFKDNSLVALRIRYHDSSNAKPEAAPPDRYIPETIMPGELSIRWEY